MTRMILDPVTRIEGHLRIELEIEGTTIVRARSSGTSYRGFENILRGRDPRDAAHITQRICGVCPIPHGRAACEAFEAAAACAPPPQAVFIRNVVQAANFIDSHLLHFYAMVLPDFVTGLPLANGDRRAAQPQVRPDGARLDAKSLAEHVLASLGARRACHEIIVALAGKMPHAAGIVPGGVTVVPSARLLGELAVLVEELRAFVDGPYASDAQILRGAFPSYDNLGASSAAFMAFGAFPDAAGNRLLPGGLCDVTGGIAPIVDTSTVTESTGCAHYGVALPAHPAAGATEPMFGRAGAYSWIKAPRLAGQPCEVGPLARAILSSRDPGIRGVMARHLARQGEASLLTAALGTWLAGLTPDAPGLPVFPAVPPQGSGSGLTEGPRGALGHWLEIEAGVIRHYGVVSPTTWNASPADEQDVPGPIERALQGVSLADPSDPIEALRIVHSFDPCLQCAVH